MMTLHRAVWHLHNRRQECEKDNVDYLLIISSCSVAFLRLLPVLGIILLVPSALYPHGGGLDGYGCHHNRKHGGYHCHRGIFRGSMFDSKAEMLRRLEERRRSSAKSDKAIQEFRELFSGKVVGVTDGDTITVLHNNVGEKVRLHGIDCPERGQAFGTRAKQFTSDSVFGRIVGVGVDGWDRYGRTIGVVLTGGGQTLNHDLVKARVPGREDPAPSLLIFVSFFVYQNGELGALPAINRPSSIYASAQF